MVIRPLAQIIWLLQNILNIVTDDNIFDFILFVDWKFRHIDTIIKYMELNGIIKLIFISSAYIICLFISESKKKNTGIRRVTKKGVENWTKEDSDTKNIKYQSYFKWWGV